VLENQLAGKGVQYEAYYLLYDPPVSACNNGSSWLIRISTKDGSQKVVESRELAGVRASGLTVVGGGLDVAVTQSGFKGKAASATAVTGNIVSGSLENRIPFIEAWMEVK
jgi:hypothetical protein